MLSRRKLSVGIAFALAGCFSPESSDFDPDNHVPDKWHDEPKQGRADPLERSVEIDPAELSGTLEDECDDAAGRSVASVVEERLEDPDNLGPTYCCSSVNGHEKAVIVERRMSVNQEGDLISAPNFTFEAVREAAPASVTITASLYDDEHTCTAAVYVSDTLIHLTNN